MAVYVDDMYLYKVGEFKRGPYTYKMSHMIADTHKELVQMAKRIGVDPKHIQKAGTKGEHFDVTMAARKRAVAAGAIEREMFEMCKWWSERSMEGYFE